MEALSYVPRESIPTVQSGAGYEFTEYSDRAEREDAAKIWIQRYEDIKKNESTYREQADHAWKTYHGEGDSDGDDNTYCTSVVMNILKKTVDFYLSSLYPSYAKPIVDIRPTGNEQTDKIISEVADIKQLALETLMDNGNFDTPMMEVIREALICGRGILRTYIYTDPQSREQKLSWKSIPFDRIFIPEADDWQSVPYIMQLHTISKDEASLYMDPKFANHETSMPPSGTNQIDMDYSETQDSYKILEIHESPKYYLNKPAWHTFIRLDDSVVLQDGPAPYQLPGSGFPYCRPIIPNPKRGLLPVPLYESFRILHEALQMSYIKDFDQLQRAAVKFLSVIDTEGFEEFVTSQESEVTIDESIFKQIQMLGINSLNDVMVPWPLEQQVAFMDALTAKQDYLIGKIYEISGVADIQRGLTQEGETATAQRIKQFNNNLRIRNLWTNTRFAVQDSFQIACDMIHRHLGKNPIALARLSGRMLDQNDPQNQAVMYALQQPDVVMHRIDVTTESLEMIDNEIQDQKTTQALAVMKQFMADLPLVGSDPYNVLSYYKTYYQVLRNISLSPTIEKPLLENLEKTIDDLTQQVEAEKKDPQIAEQRETENLSKQIQADPQHQKIIFDKEKLAIESQDKALDRQLKQEELLIKREELQLKNVIDASNLQITREKNENDRAYQEATIVVNEMNALTAQYEAREEVRLTEMKIELDRELGRNPGSEKEEIEG